MHLHRWIRGKWMSGAQDSFQSRNCVLSVFWFIMIFKQSLAQSVKTSLSGHWTEALTSEVMKNLKQLVKKDDSRTRDETRHSASLYRQIHGFGGGNTAVFSLLLS